MRSLIGRKLEMAGRVLEFSKARPSTDPSYPLLVGRLEEVLARAKELAVAQGRGTGAARASVVRRREIRESIRSQLLRYLVVVGGAVARGNIGLDRQLRLPRSNVRNITFLTEAKAILAEAVPRKEQLAAAGMSATLLEELERELKAFEAESEAVNLKRRERMTARGELETASADLMEVIRLLDGVNRYRYGKDAETMALWHAIHRIFAVARPGTPEPPASSVAPAA